MSASVCAVLSCVTLCANPRRSGVYVKDLSNHVVKSVAEMDKLMTLGYNNRSVGATLMNAESSRSHSIFTINVESIGQALDGSGGEHIIAGKLNLVDLAGSERQAKTGAAGDRLKVRTICHLAACSLHVTHFSSTSLRKRQRSTYH